MRLLAIDPGTTKSGYVILEDGVLAECRHDIPNEELLVKCEDWPFRLPHEDNHLVIEKVECYGSVIGESTLETVYWSGRFHQNFSMCPVSTPVGRIGRKEIKLHLTGRPQAKDKDIRQAIIDRYPATGGGRTPQIGLKASPGPLFGVSSHAWAALAIALTWMDKHGHNVQDQATVAK